MTVIAASQMNPLDRFRNDVLNDVDGTRSQRLSDVKRLFESLSPAEAQAMVGEGGTDLLAELVEDMTQPAAFPWNKGGWDADQRQAMYALLAGKLSGVQMAVAASTAAERGDGLAIGEAMGRLPADRDEDKFAFVSLLAHSEQVPAMVDDPGLLTTSYRAQPLALQGALAECLAGIETPAIFQRAIDELGLEELATVVEAGVGRMRIYTPWQSITAQLGFGESGRTELHSTAGLRILENAARLDPDDDGCSLFSVAAVMPDVIRSLGAGAAGEAQAVRAEKAAEALSCSLGRERPAPPVRRPTQDI